MKYTYEYYDNKRKINRVSFHIGAIALIMLVCSIFAKSFVFLALFAFIFVICLVMWIFTKNKIGQILASFKLNCPNCMHDIIYNEQEKYYILGALVDKITFDLSFDDNKRIVKIKEYKCAYDNFKYTIVETYYISKKGALKLLKKVEQVDNN